MKKIALITNKPHYGGAEKQIILLANGLANSNYDVTLFFLRSGDAYLDKVNENVKCIMPEDGTSAFQNVFRLYIFLRRYSPDVVVSFLFQASVLTRCFKIFFSYKNITSLRNTSYGSILRDKIIKLTAHLDDHTSANSSLALKLLSVSGVPQSFIPNIVSLDDQDIKRTYNGSNKYIFVGRLTDQKNIFNLLEAFVAYKQKTNSLAQLTIVGDGELREEIKSRILDLNSESYITLEGIIDDPSNIIRESDYLILPSVREGMPNVIMEAIQQGVPVIVTSVGAIPDLLSHKESALIIDGFEDSDILSSLNLSYSLLPCIRSRIAEKALSKIKAKCSQGSVLNNWQNIIEEREIGNS